jgi:hypothetical protein
MADTADTSEETRKKRERKKKIKRREVKRRRKKINVITRKKMNEMNTRKHEGRKKVERKNQREVGFENATIFKQTGNNKKNRSHVRGKRNVKTVVRKR